MTWNEERRRGGGGKARVWLHFATVLSILAGLAIAASRASVFGNAWARGLVWLALLNAIYLAVHRDTWLPFLGEAAFPPALLRPAQAPGADTAVSVAVPPNTRYVAYWAASPGADFASPRTAYASSTNAGVAVPEAGRAALSVACPGAYRVPLRGKLPKHLHYRFVGADGMMSAVHTRTLACLPRRPV